MTNEEMITNLLEDNARMSAAIRAVLDRPLVKDQLDYVDKGFCSKHLPVEVQERIKYNSSVWVGLRNSIINKE